MSMEAAPDSEAGGEQSPGALLRDWREQAGLSAEELAQALNLLPVQVHSLERDDFAALGGDVFARGHVRNYARCLGHDPAPVLAVYDARRPAGRSVSRRRSMRPPSLDHTLGLWHWGVIGALLVVAGLWWWQREPAVPVPPPVAQLPPLIELSSAEPDSTAVDVTEPGTPLGASLVSSGDAGMAALEPLPAGPDQLRLDFSGDCWVQVTDVHGRRLFADQRGAGDTLELEGDGPFQVLLGHARVVEMTYNGEPVSIPVASDSRRANLTVGEPRASL